MTKIQHDWRVANNGDIVALCGATGNVNITAVEQDISCKRCLRRPYLVFFGTLTQVVRALSAEQAKTMWMQRFREERGMRVDDDEVRARRLVASDREWIESSMGRGTERNEEMHRVLEML